MTNETPAQDLRSALEQCRDQFEFYVQQHLAKAPPDMDKAATNQEFVELCNAALAQPAENAKGGEVVAWMYDYRLKLRGDDIDWKVGYVSTVKPTNIRPHEPDYHNIRPLYAHPPAAEPVGLREEVAALKAFQEGGRQALLASMAEGARYKNALDHFVEDFEHDFVVDGQIVDAPDPMLKLHYTLARAALATPARTDDVGVGGERDRIELIARAISKHHNNGEDENWPDRPQGGMPLWWSYTDLAQSIAALSPAPDRGEVGRASLDANDIADIIAECVSGPNMHRSERLKANHRLDQLTAANRILAALKPADATPAGEEKMRRTLEFIRDTDASARFLREAAKTTLAAFSTQPTLDEGDK